MKNKDTLYGITQFLPAICFGSVQNSFTSQHEIVGHWRQKNEGRMHNVYWLSNSLYI